MNENEMKTYLTEEERGTHDIYMDGYNAKPSVSAQAFVNNIREVDISVCENKQGNKVLHISNDITIFMTEKQLRQLAEVIREELEKGEVSSENIQNRDKELAGT